MDNKTSKFNSNNNLIIESGYTYFGQQNKDKFNEEISNLEEKVKYVAHQSSKWKELSDEEKEEWNVKAKEASASNESQDESSE